MRGSENEEIQKINDYPSASKFIMRTYSILQDKSSHKIVHWNDKGDGFVIISPHEFAEQILPKYFKHNNFTSFVRQLHLYNFKKGTSEVRENSFCHKFFLKGHPELLCNIQRKIKSKKERSILEQSADYLPKISVVTNRQKLMEQRIKTLQKDYDEYSNQFSLLLNEVMRIRDKNSHLEDVVQCLSAVCAIQSYPEYSPESPVPKRKISAFPDPEDDFSLEPQTHRKPLLYCGSSIKRPTPTRSPVLDSSRSSLQLIQPRYLKSLELAPSINQPSSFVSVGSPSSNSSYSNLKRECAQIESFSSHSEGANTPQNN